MSHSRRWQDGSTAPRDRQGRAGVDYFDGGVYQMHLPLTTPAQPITERSAETRGQTHRGQVPWRPQPRDALRRSASPSGLYHTPPPPPTTTATSRASQLSPSSMAMPDSTLFSDIQRTAELVEEFKRLKAQGGTREERRALQRRVKALRVQHEAHLETSAQAVPQSSPPPPPQQQQPPAPAMQDRPSHASRHADPNAALTSHAGVRPEASASLRSPQHHRPMPATQSALIEPRASYRHTTHPRHDDDDDDALAREEQARVHRSVCFAIVLAESHVRHELQHKWERRWLKMKAACAEERVRIALAPARDGAMSLQNTSSEPPPHRDASLPKVDATVQHTPDERVMDTEDVRRAAAQETQASPHSSRAETSASQVHDDAAARAQLEAEQSAAAAAAAATAEALQHAQERLAEDERAARDALASAADACHESCAKNAQSEARDLHQAEQRVAIEREESNERTALKAEEHAVHATLSAEAAEAATAASHAAEAREAAEREAMARVVREQQDALEHAERPERGEVQKEEEIQRTQLAEALSAVAELQKRKDACQSDEDVARRAVTSDEAAARTALSTLCEEGVAQAKASAEEVPPQVDREQVCADLDNLARTVVASAIQSAAAAHTEAEQDRARLELVAREAAHQQQQQQREAQEALVRAVDVLDDSERSARQDIEAMARAEGESLRAHNTLLRDMACVNNEEASERAAVEYDAAAERDDLLVASDANRAEADRNARARENQEAQRAREVAASSSSLRAALLTVCEDELTEMIANAAHDYLAEEQRARQEAEAARQKKQAEEDDAAEAERAALAARAQEEAAAAEEKATHARQRAAEEAVEACMRAEESGRHTLETEEDEARSAAHADGSRELAKLAHDEALAAQEAAAAEEAAVEDERRRDHEQQRQQAADAAARDEKQQVSAELDALATKWIVSWVGEAQAEETANMDEEESEEDATVASRSVSSSPHAADVLSDIADAPSATAGEDNAMDSSVDVDDDKVGQMDLPAASTEDESTVQPTGVSRLSNSIASSSPVSSPSKSALSLSPRVLMEGCDALLQQWLSEAATASAVPALSAAPPLSAETVMALSRPASHSPEHDVDTSESDSDDDDDDTEENERSFEAMSPKVAGSLVQQTLSASAQSTGASPSPPPSSASSDSVFEFQAIVKTVPMERRGSSGVPLVSPCADSMDDEVASTTHTASRERTSPVRKRDPAEVNIAADALLHSFIAEAARIQQQRTVDPNVPMCASPRGLGPRSNTSAFQLLDSDAGQIVANYLVGEAGTELARALGLPLPETDAALVPVNATPLSSAEEGHAGRPLHSVRAEEFEAALFAGLSRAVLAANQTLLATLGTSSPTASTEDTPAVTASQTLPPDWHGALQALAERLAANLFEYTAQGYLRTLEKTGLRGDTLFLTEEVEQTVLRSADVVRTFATQLSPHDCRYLALHYLDCVRRGSDVVDSVVAHSQRILRENLFQRPSQGCVVGAPTTGSATFPRNLSFPTGSPPSSPSWDGAVSSPTTKRVLPPTMPVRRAGLTQMVFEHALENVMQDILLDTAAWVAFIL